MTNSQKLLKNTYLKLFFILFPLTTTPGFDTSQRHPLRTLVQKKLNFTLIKVICANNAEKKDNLARIQDLIDRGADVNAIIEDDNGIQHATSSLHSATLFGHIKIAELLLQKNVNINLKLHGSTPLHDAISFNRCALIEMFIQHDAHLNVQDRRGNTPLQLLQKKPPQNPYFNRYQQIIKTIITRLENIHRTKLLHILKNKPQSRDITFSFEMIPDKKRSFDSDTNTESKKRKL